MPVVLHENLPLLIVQSRQALGCTNKEFAKIAGVSLRTISRWTSNQSSPGFEQARTLARAVFPKDPVLAADLALIGLATPEALGLVAPKAAAALAAPPPPAVPLPARLLAESVVCAAAEELDTPPRAVRGILRAAFRRAREMNLSVEALDGVLSPPEASSAPKAEGRAKKGAAPA